MYFLKTSLAFLVALFILGVDFRDAVAFRNPSPCQIPSIPDVSNPRIIGNGSSGSCTEQAFKNALSQGGSITFNCGPDPHTITMTSQAMVNLSLNTIIEGGELITLSGGGTTRILSMDTDNFERTTPTLTVKNLTFRDGRSSGTQISLGTDYDGGGGAIYYVGGNVQVFNCIFEDNACDDLGPDLAGGAIFGNGRGRTTIVNSDFRRNHCANGGAIGNLWTSTFIYNGIIEDNEARGRGANYHDEDNIQHGQGGNGGGIQMDGAENGMYLCGVTLRNNTGNALGGGVFRTTYSGTGTMVIEQSVIEGNTITNQPDYSAAGGIFFMGGPISITNTTITNNTANMFGAIQFEDTNTGITLDDVQVSNNTARTGLAAIWIGGGVHGTISNSDVSKNNAPGTGGFAAAFAGNGIPRVTLSNTSILDNIVGNGFNPISCQGQFVEGDGNYQWPVLRSGGGTDDPDALCSSNITIGRPVAIVGVIYVDLFATGVETGSSANPFDTVSEGVNSVANGGTVRIRSGSYSETIALNESKSLTLQGGWDVSFTSQTPNTTIIKAPKVSRGSLILQMLTVRP